jgi:hypothetical protein
MSEQGWTHNFFRNRANFWEEKAAKAALDCDRGMACETTLRAKPKELPHGTLRRNRTGDLRAKTQRELEWRASGCWIAAVYILHYTCPVRGYP